MSGRRGALSKAMEKKTRREEIEVAAPDQTTLPPDVAATVATSATAPETPEDGAGEGFDSLQHAGVSAAAAQGVPAPRGLTLAPPIDDGTAEDSAADDSHDSDDSDDDAAFDAAIDEEVETALVEGASAAATPAAASPSAVTDPLPEPEVVPPSPGPISDPIPAPDPTPAPEPAGRRSGRSSTRSGSGAAAPVAKAGTDLTHLRKVMATGRDQREAVKEMPPRSGKGTYVRLPVHLQDVLGEYCDPVHAPMADFVAAVLDAYFRDAGFLPPAGEGHRPNEKALERARRESRETSYNY